MSNSVIPTPARKVSILLLISVATLMRAQTLNIKYDRLSDCQRSRFETLPVPQPGQKAWELLDDSQRLEYAGGTQALNRIEIQFPQCKGLGEVKELQAIFGSRPTYPSAEQFNVEVGWLADADKNFKSVRHWTKHIAWLHPGQYGYQENRNGNPFLGIVVLFNQDQPAVGQFHMDFRSFFAHYFPDNGNVAKNYKRYCNWYGTIDGYSQQCAPDTRKDWRASPGRPETDVSASPLVEVVREFLEEWYVTQDLDDLFNFVARDNAIAWLASNGILPMRISRTEWETIFERAYLDGPGSVRFSGLSDAIEFKAPVNSELSYFAGSPKGGPFAILNPHGTPAESLFPPDDLPESQIDSAALFLRHLRSRYLGQKGQEQQLYLVIFENRGAGLIQESCILYWIRESGKWKLAAFQGGD